MCVAYQSSSGLLLSALESLPCPDPDEPAKLIRQGDLAQVFFSGGEVTLMNWGFHRGNGHAACNARLEALSSGMWAEAFRNRRCLIPLLNFFEQSNPQRSDTTHSYRRRDGRMMLAAGLWEYSLQGGRAFSMITVDAPHFMRATDLRIPLILNLDQALAFLAGGLSDFVPAVETLIASEVPNPLKTSPERAGLF